MKKNMALAFFAIMLLGAFLRLYGISSQPPTGDDISVAVSASNYIESGNLGPTMWNHPNLRNILVYLTRWLFGDGVWGLKTVSLLLGALSVPLLGLTAKRLFKENRVALLAAFFLAIDPLHIDFSRQAVHEVYMMFFALSGMLFALKFRDGLRPVWLILAGFLFGLGIASKWYVVFPLLITYYFLIYSLWKNRQAGNRKRDFSLTLFISSAMIILPLTVYLLTFVPWFQRGYGISDWLYLQRAMYIETSTHGGYNPYGFEIDHRAYLWFIKPVAFADFIFSKGQPIILIGISNPLVWLLTIPATIYLCYKGVMQKTADFIFIFCLFWLSYVPFLITSRPIWAHTAFSVLPFAFMAIAFSFFDLLSNKNYGNRVLIMYLVLVVLVSIPLYLLATGKGLEIVSLSPLVELYRPLNER